ncbi:hypothetical protein [Agrobacterium tumefaciens]|uniref:hypothetical protein n=1 Tax=Agrobacterium tumefaciens TaxID=358 RepID=UPI001F2FC08C|nr:hypothetical protein [Agrobacterium tumefaciens]
MTHPVYIEPGKWVLAFDEHYGPHNRDFREHLERFSKRGGGWDRHRKGEIFHVLKVKEVMPKTYTFEDPATGARSYLKTRQSRFLVIAAGATREDMIALRDKFFAIGVETSGRIEKEMYRRIEKYAAREDEKAVEKIHKLLPHIFGRAR